VYSFLVVSLVRAFVRWRAKRQGSTPRGGSSAQASSSS
jgi:hypothetical protein